MNCEGCEVRRGIRRVIPSVEQTAQTDYAKTRTLCDICEAQRKLLLGKGNPRRKEEIERTTKVKMAQAIVQEIYHMPAVPSPDHWHVVRLVRCSKKVLREGYELALSAKRARAHAERLRAELYE